MQNKIEKFMPIMMTQQFFYNFLNVNKTRLVIRIASLTHTKVTRLDNKLISL